MTSWFIATSQSGPLLARTLFARFLQTFSEPDNRLATPTFGKFTAYGWLEEGSDLEDSDTTLGSGITFVEWRTKNHFYDPITGKGLSDGVPGQMDSFTRATRGGPGVLDSVYGWPNLVPQFREEFLLMGNAELNEMLSASGSVTPVFVDDHLAKYRFTRIFQGQEMTFLVGFIKENGKWKIASF